jgi:serine/threonine protein kinase
MITILNEDAPKLGDKFSDNFRNFVEKCLIKDFNKRPKYNLLLQYPFVLEYKQLDVDVKSWYEKVMNQADINSCFNASNNNNNNNNTDSEGSATTTPTAANSSSSMGFLV